MVMGADARDILKFCRTFLGLYHTTSATCLLKLVHTLLDSTTIDSTVCLYFVVGNACKISVVSVAWFSIRKIFYFDWSFANLTWRLAYEIPGPKC